MYIFVDGGHSVRMVECVAVVCARVPVRVACMTHVRAGMRAPKVEEVTLTHTGCCTSHYETKLFHDDRWTTFFNRTCTYLYLLV